MPTLPLVFRIETKPLRATGEWVSELALGTNYLDSQIDRETSFEILDTYYEAGGRFLATANNYATWLEGYDEPQSEYLLGEWLDERDVRDEMTVATKLGFNPPGMDRSLDPELIHESVDASRDRMGIDTIDLLYAHVDDPDTPQEASMEAFAEVVDAGAVRYLGASNFQAWRVARANRIAEERGWPRFECVQPRLLVPDPGPGRRIRRATPGHGRTDRLLGAGKPGRPRTRRRCRERTAARTTRFRTVTSARRTD